MTPEQHDFATAVTADIRKLAYLVERLAKNLGYPQTEAEAHRIGEDVLDAFNQLEGQ